MIAYLPRLYPDETMYSWFARYNAHIGYQGYVSAGADLLENRQHHINVEFHGKIRQEIRDLLNHMYGMKYLIEHHTMYPQYARFTSQERRKQALDSMIHNTDDFYTILRFPKSNGRTMLYCPVCVTEDRENYGETYWHREWLLRDFTVCPRHHCRLKDTGIQITSKTSPALYAAEEIIEDTSYKEVPDTVETALGVYMSELFQMSLPTDETPPPGEYLLSRLEGTPYISPTGQVSYTKKMLQDILLFYDHLPGNRITEYHHVQQILLSKNINFREICQMALFLKIPVQDLALPVLPKRSQMERFEESVNMLLLQGMSTMQIARRLKCSKSTVSNVYHKLKQRLI